MPPRAAFLLEREMAIDPKQYQVAEEKADKFLDKLKSSGFTALILVAGALVILGLMLA